MKLRIDIQIMRGIAVLVVVLFHLGFSSFTNGFLGVDLFFVVSGFLMAVLYKQGKVKEFYLRRAARLLPAYFATIVLTLIFSAFITLPTEHSQVALQGVFATLLSSNVGFWLTDSYFDSSLFKPLLHLWSLGVEIQFYLIVPLLFWLYWKSKAISLAILTGSLLACLVMASISPYTAFFMTPFRIWQFLIGAAVALYLTEKGAVKYNYPLIGGLGALSLLALIAFYPVDGKALGVIYGHPGIAALLTTLASSLVLAFGLPTAFLGTVVAKAVKKIGDWSYSIYLAHFPVIVLYLYQPFSGTNLSPKGITDTLILIALIAVFSALIYLLFDKRRWRFRFSWLPVLITMSLATVFISNYFSKQGYTEKELNLLSYEFERPLYRCGKIFRFLHPASDYCELTQLGVEEKGRVLLIGDSHSDSIKESFVREAERKGIKVYFPIHSPPVLGKTKTERILQIAAEVDADAIVAHYRYTNALAILETDFVKKVQESDIKLYWIATTPNYDEIIPEFLWELKEQLPDSKIPNDTEFAHQVIEQLSIDGVSYLDPRPVFCTETEKVERCKIVHGDGQPYYFDRHHLTRTGAKQLESHFNQWLKVIIYDN